MNSVLGAVGAANGGGDDLLADLEARRVVLLAREVDLLHLPLPACAGLLLRCDDPVSHAEVHRDREAAPLARAAFRSSRRAFASSACFFCSATLIRVMEFGK